MQITNILLALPLALALDAASITALVADASSVITAAAGGLPSSLDFCITAKDEAGASCGLSLLGWKPAAISYQLAQASNSAFLALESDGTAFPTPSNAADYTIATDPAHLYSYYANYISDLPESDRSYASSYFAQVIALQTDAAAGTAASTSSSRAAAPAGPRQTGLIAAAGVAAGVAGLALGL